MALTRYNPFAALDNFPELRLFNDSLSRAFEDFQVGRPWTPAVDILESEDALVLHAELPGMEMKDIQVGIENGTLSLKGQRKFEGETTKNGYHRIERSYGTFARHFTLPETVDAEKVSAEYKNGILTVTLPKKEIAKPRSIKVELKN